MTEYGSEASSSEVPIGTAEAMTVSSSEAAIAEAMAQAGSEARSAGGMIEAALEAVGAQATSCSYGAAGSKHDG